MFDWKWFVCLPNYFLFIDQGCVSHLPHHTYLETQVEKKGALRSEYLKRLWVRDHKPNLGVHSTGPVCIVLFSFYVDHLQERYKKFWKAWKCRSQSIEEWQRTMPPDVNYYLVLPSNQFSQIHRGRISNILMLYLSNFHFKLNV